MLEIEVRYIEQSVGAQGNDGPYSWELGDVLCFGRWKSEQFRLSVILVGGRGRPIPSDKDLPVENPKRELLSWVLGDHLQMKRVVSLQVKKSPRFSIWGKEKRVNKQACVLRLQFAFKFNF